MMINRFAPIVLVVAATWSMATAGPAWRESSGPVAWSAEKVRRDAPVPDGLLSEERMGEITDKMMDWAIIRELIMSEVNSALRESSATRELVRSEVSKVLRETSKTTKSLVQSLMTMLKDGDDLERADRRDDGQPRLTFPRLG
ncbi:uncharacterized protein LOC118427843 [Branchiostoma floridae]|uniref:Uncharacterized protein LOC118427843 n=1 Tax=Branchiostoma floridae TaxID=7739 RepID=A0A9J7M3M7_BRAFL|nr:uncharacterized protein LOC118427843 [Branchiostoma floridae]